MQNFAPTIYIDGKPQRMVVYVGHKTMICLLFEPDFIFNYEYLAKLDNHLAKHAPIIS